MSNFSLSITSLAIQVSSILSSTPTYTISTEYANASCKGGCEIGADKVRLVYWKPEPESSNTSIPLAPFSIVSDDYTLYVPLLRGPSFPNPSKHFSFGICNLHQLKGQLCVGGRHSNRQSLRRSDPSLCSRSAIHRSLLPHELEPDQLHEPV